MSISLFSNGEPFVPLPLPLGSFCREHNAMFICFVVAQGQETNKSLCHSQIAIFFLHHPHYSPHLPPSSSPICNFIHFTSTLF